MQTSDEGQSWRKALLPQLFPVGEIGKDYYRQAAQGQGGEEMTTEEEIEQLESRLAELYRERNMETTAFVKVRGEPMNLVEKRNFTAGKMVRGQWIPAIPLLIVERKWRGEQTV